MSDEYGRLKKQKNEILRRQQDELIAENASIKDQVVIDTGIIKAHFERIKELEAALAWIKANSTDENSRGTASSAASRMLAPSFEPSESDNDQ